MSLPAVLRTTKKLMKRMKTKRNKRVVDKTRSEMADDFDDVRHKYDEHTNDGRLVISDLTVHANKIHEQAKKTFDEVETINASLLNTNDGHYEIPSTPRYTESSFEHFVRYPVIIPKRENRTFVIILTSLTFFVQMFSRDIWIPLFEPALIAFPKWSKTSLALFPIWDTIVSVFLMTPVCIIINKYGIKTSLLCSCVASTLGTCARCLPSIGESTFVVHASAMFLSSASVVVRPLTVTISTCCFRTGERNLATGILTSASMAGTAAGLLTTVVLREPSFSLAVPSTNAEWKTIVMWTMYACFAMNVVCSLLVCALFPRESTRSERYDGPSATARKFATCVLHIKNSDLLYVVLSYVCSNAFSWPWYQLIDVTYSKMGMTRQFGADCRMWMIVHTCVLTLSVCWFADRSAGSNKWFGLACLLLSSAFLLWIVWTLNFRRLHGKFPIVPRITFPEDLIVGVMFAFPLSWTAQSLQYELVAEHAHPMPENVAVGIAETLKILSECIVYTLMAVFPKFHTYWLHVFTFAAGCLGAAFLALLKVKKNSDR